MSNYRVIVSTCDAYLNCIRVFAHQFNKYWGSDQKVLVAGFSYPKFDLPKNFDFFSLGAAEEYPKGKWSNAIRLLLNEISDDVFVFMLDDYWLTGPAVDVNGVQLLVDYARANPKVVRIDLTPERYENMQREEGYNWAYGQTGHLELIRSKSGVQYYFSLMASVWRRDRILDFLEPDWDPWQVEIEGTRNLSRMDGDLLTLGTTVIPVTYHGGIMPNPAGKGAPSWLETRYFSEEDRVELEQLGLLGLQEIGIPNLIMAE